MWHNTGWQPCVRSDDGFLICGSSSDRFSPRRTLNATASITMSCSCSQMAFWDISTCILQSASLRCFIIWMFNICWCDLRACVSDGVGTKVVQLSEHSRLPPPPHRLVSPPSCWNGSKDDHENRIKSFTQHPPDPVCKQINTRSGSSMRDAGALCSHGHPSWGFKISKQLNKKVKYWTI